MKRVITSVIVGVLLLFSSIVQAQLPFNGKVIGKKDKLPLAGVSVTVKSTGITTTTNNVGLFQIKAKENDLLLISFIGYEKVALPIASTATFIQVELNNEAELLNEVVVTALGFTRKKKSLGYAVQELKSKDFSEARESNILSALEGKIAGVRITNSQGDMGSSRIIIRGETSIAGNNQPLFILNGVPVDNSQLGAGGSRDYANAISDLNPDDIESISVLKGPNAAALYGSRAAAGVVLIQTKSGKSKKGLGITLTSGASLEDLLVLPDYQNAYGQGSDGKFSYVDGKGGGVNDGVDESWGPKLDGRLINQFFSNGTPAPFVAHENNVKDFFRKGYIVSNGVSVADANAQFDYRLSYNNFKQEGVIPNSSQGKNSLSLNSTVKLSPKLSIIADANYFQNDAANLPGAGGRRATSTMLQFTWFGRQVDINQLKNYTDVNGNTFNWNNSYYSNPYFIAYENTVQQRRNRFIGKTGFNYKIDDALTVNFFTATDYYNDRRKSKVAFGTNGTPFGSYQEDGYTVNESNTELNLHYKRNIYKQFSLDVIAGGNNRARFYEENIQLAPRLAVAKLYALSNSRDPLVSSNYFTKLQVYSVFSSAQVGYKDVAFLNGTVRNDWSSTLPTQNRSYFYPSVSGSLILSEAFDIKNEVLSYAKIRGGWSKVGKDADPYQLRNTYIFNAPFGTSPQLSASGIDLNANLKPETTTSEEAGAEFALFNNKLRFDVSVYNTNSYNQILSVDVSPATGYSKKLLNAGKINNKGLEIQLGATPIKKKIVWDINVNYARNKSKVLQLDDAGNLQNYVLGAISSAQILASVGQPYGTIFGNAYLRNANGDILVSATGAPRIDPTKKVLGKYTPDWIGGITNSFSYKGFNLSFLIDGNFGGSVYNGTFATGTYTGVLATTLPGRGAENGGLKYYYPSNLKANGTVSLVSGATAPNGELVYDDGILFPGVTDDGKVNVKLLPAQQYYKSFRTIDEANVFDATFVKLREVKFGYNITSAWLKKANLSGAKISLVGRNLLFLYNKVPHIDPETAQSVGNAQGLESLSLPTSRSYGVNISLQF
jgi:TonB-linked SusC/RagA family outer membrane protein